MPTKPITTHRPVTDETGKVRLVGKPPRQSVSDKIRAKHSKRQRAVPPAKAGRVK
jgi:hypothetical protein